MLAATVRETLQTSFRALRHRNFRLYWSGQLVSLIGTWMQSVAQGWLMHRLTSSPLMLGLLGFSQFLPVMLLSLWAGAIIDAIDKRRLLMLTQTAFLLQALALALLVTTGIIRPWMLLSLAFIFGMVNAFDLPGRQSFAVEMVGREDLSNAIALNSAAFNTARVVGPALAGVLLAVVGEAGCFWVNALSYVAVLVGLFRMEMAARRSAGVTPRRALETTLEGIRYARGVEPIRNLLVLLGFTAGLGFQYMVLLPVYAREILHAGPEGYGLMVSAFGLGSLVSAVSMTQRLGRWALRRNLLTGLTAAAIGMGVFAWSRAFPLSLAMGFLAGYGLILYVATTNTLIQITTDDRFRGRVMSLYTLMFVGTAPLGALVSGSIAQRFGAPIATTFSACVLFGGAVWVYRRLRALAAREAERAPITAEPEGMG